MRAGVGAINLLRNTLHAVQFFNLYSGAEAKRRVGAVCGLQPQPLSYEVMNAVFMRGFRPFLLQEFVSLAML